MKKDATIEIVVKTEEPGGTKTKAIAAHLSQYPSDMAKVFALEAMFYATLWEIFGEGEYVCVIRKRKEGPS